MEKLLSRLLEKYGLLPIAIAIIIAVVIVWVLAHFSAAPGGNVSVLWGLVQYTKDNPSGTKRIDLAVKSDNLNTLQPNKILKQNLPDNALAVSSIATPIHGISETNLEPTLNAIRTQRHLRALEALESGRRVADTARETYFFVYKTALATYGDEKLLDFSKAEVNRYRKTKNFFEVHSHADGAFILIAFTSEIDASRLSVPASEGHKISISALPWEKMNSLISIPIKKIQSAKIRTLDLSENNEIDIFDAQVR